MRILIVEDEIKIAKALSKALSREGRAVDIESNTDDAFQMASFEPYALLIVDRMLPGSFKDGVAMIQALRDKGIETPILLLTALGTTEQKTEGLDAGADDYLTKPFAVEELLARVRALLRRPANNTGTSISANGLTLHINERTVSYNGEPIELTGKEYSLLEFLVSSKGKILSKDQIIDRVWSFDSDILPNNVEAYIKRLREKIDKRFNVTIIKTVRGVGYVVSDEHQT